MSGFIVFLAAFFVFLIIKSRLDEKNRIKKLTEYFKSSFGSYEGIKPDEKGWYFTRRYYENINSGSGLDDTTWADLDMDRLFVRMNTTLTGYGQEILYDMLRMPQTDAKKLEKRDSMISFLGSDERVRTRLQLLFAHIGRDETMSLTDCIRELVELGIREDMGKLMRLDALCFFLAVFSTALIFVSPMAGFFVFFGVLFFNLCVYFIRKKKISPYVSCLSVIFRLIYSMGRLKGYEGSWGGIEEFMDGMTERVERLGGLTKGAFLLTSGRRATGSLWDVVLDYFRMFLHLDILRFYTILKNVLKSRDEIIALAGDAGTLDACIAVASYRRSLKCFCRPQFDSAQLAVTGLSHPLEDDCVQNDIETGRCVLLTGSNASGKSTFLKSVCLSALMAQTIYTVCAEEYRFHPVMIATSIAVPDDIGAGDSYYMAEIKSIKRIMDYGEEETPLLCAIDEVLRGTNTAERIASSAEILMRLSRMSLCFAATHDLELANILSGVYENYHFSEDVDTSRETIVFNYKLTEGSAKSRNAIKLLTLMGYDSAITDRARRRCDNYIETGKWV